jgi:hypothetical protein
MKRAGLPAAMAIVFACTVMLGAQSSSTQGGRTPQDGSATPPSRTSAPPTSTGQDTSTNRRTRSTQTTDIASNDQQQPMTLTGCLAAGDQSGAVGTAGATTSPSSASSGTSRTPRTGTSATGTTSFMLNNASGTGSTATTYALQGSALQGHVGQRVEVIGVMVPEPRANTRRSSRTTSTSQTAATPGPSETTTPRLRVTSVKMLSANCSGSTNR